MRTKKKAFVLAFCAVLLVVSTVFATMAFLKAETEVVTNTFTVGNVSFEDDANTELDEGLTEAKVNEYGQPVDEDGNVVEEVSDAPRVNGNEYKLIPGHTYTKDPTVKIAADSEAAYVRMIVTITDLKDVKEVFGITQGTYFLPQYFVEGWDNNIWKTTGTIVEENNTATYEFWYVESETVSTVDTDAKLLEPLFTAIKVPEDISNDALEKLEDMDIKIEAHAIQADGFESAEEAWAAWEE